MEEPVSLGAGEKVSSVVAVDLTGGRLGSLELEEYTCIGRIVRIHDRGLGL